jgi:hypothetical protein
VLVVSVGALAAELCKNLVLAGVGAVTLLDAAVVAAEDLAAQFLIEESAIGRLTVCAYADAARPAATLTWWWRSTAGRGIGRAAAGAESAGPGDGGGRRPRGQACQLLCTIPRRVPDPRHHRRDCPSLPPLSPPVVVGTRRLRPHRRAARVRVHRCMWTRRAGTRGWPCLRLMSLECWDSSLATSAGTPTLSTSATTRSRAGRGAFP